MSSPPAIRFFLTSLHAARFTSSLSFALKDSYALPPPKSLLRLRATSRINSFHSTESESTSDSPQQQSSFNSSVDKRPFSRDSCSGGKDRRSTLPGSHSAT